MNRLAGMKQILEAFADSGVQSDKIERFLNGEPRRGGGSVRDHIAADMTNQLLDALGQQPTQHGAGVKRLRERGWWRVYDRRPE